MGPLIKNPPTMCPKMTRRSFMTTVSSAAAVGAVQHFVGERRFREMVFKNGLPWVMAFDGLPKDGQPNPDDGTVVVYGDDAGLLAARAGRRIDELVAEGKDVTELKAALDAGKHVVCEKPLAVTVPEADAVRAAAQQAGIALILLFAPIASLVWILFKDRMCPFPYVAGHIRAAIRGITQGGILTN